MPKVNLPSLVKVDYTFFEGSQVLITNYKIIHGYSTVCTPLFNCLDQKIN